MEAEITTTAAYTSSLDQFSARVHTAAERTVTRATARGSLLSQVLAPKRTLRLAATIRPGIIAPGWGSWIVGPLKYALAQEKGARPHSIGAEGQILANKGDNFGPVRGPVLHPGNRGIHFLLKAYEQVKAELLPDLARELR